MEGSVLALQGSGVEIQGFICLAQKLVDQTLLYQHWCKFFFELLLSKVIT